MRRPLLSASIFALLAGSGCAPEAPLDDPNATAFADAEAEVGADKEDTGYQTNLDALEVEMTLEADVKADGYSIAAAPLELGQYALTYMRETWGVYIQSLAEDYSHGAQQVEWLIDGKWVPNGAVGTADRAKLTRFRLTKVNAIVLHEKDPIKLAGRVWKPIVPIEPGAVYRDAGASCGEERGDIHVSQDVYWYVWAPKKSGCRAKTQEATATVTQVLPKGGTTYPEFDKLTADGQLDVLVIWGQVDHGDLKDTDWGYGLSRQFESQLRNAGFTKAAQAPRGLRYTRVRGGITTNVDIYTPGEFAGLGDWAHISNFDDGVNAHEVIVYNGHSMLGASDFWARPELYRDPSKYQVFIYNGCLGYAYYVNPILEGKKSWDNVDVVSNVTETPFAIMVGETASAIGKLAAGAERGGKVSWQSILTGMNQISGSSGFYGASGIRNNGFKPRR